MTAASPGVVSLFFRNEHYPTEEAYLFAIADAMKQEYETIARAGIVLQIDCPDLGMGRHIQYADLSLAEWRKKAQLHVEALDHAVANIPPEQLRMHLCWGNYEGPHHCDVPLADVIDIVFRARPSAIAIEAANPRHAHEWKLFETLKLPDGKVLIPGVIESKSNFIEHPELIAQRIGRYAKLVGRENVIAGSDCGFGTWVGQAAVARRPAPAARASCREPGHARGEGLRGGSAASRAGADAGRSGLRSRAGPSRVGFYRVEGVGELPPLLVERAERGQHLVGRALDHEVVERLADDPQEREQGERRAEDDLLAHAPRRAASGSCSWMKAADGLVRHEQQHVVDRSAVAWRSSRVASSRTRGATSRTNAALVGRALGLGAGLEVLR